MLDDAESHDTIGESLESEDELAASPYTLDDLREMQKLGLPKPAEISEKLWQSATPPLTVRTSLRRRAVEQAAKIADKSPFSVGYASAIDTIFAIMENPAMPPRLRLDAAFYIADQAAGKSTQQIQHQGEIALELRRAAEELDARYREIEARLGESTNPKALDSARATVDAFLQAHVGTDFRVGKRGEAVGQESEQITEQGLDKRDSAGKGEIS